MWESNWHNRGSHRRPCQQYLNKQREA